MINKCGRCFFRGLLLSDHAVPVKKSWTFFDGIFFLTFLSIRPRNTVIKKENKRIAGRMQKKDFLPHNAAFLIFIKKNDLKSLTLSQKGVII